MTEPPSPTTTLPKPLEPSESFTAEYDAWSRVVKLTDDADGGATVAEYQWDGQGRRIVAEVYDGGTLDETRHFYYRDHSMIEQRVDGTADTDMDVQHVWGLEYVDELIARHDGTDWLFALQDANYRVTAIVDDTGAVQERYRYTAYGRRTALNPDFSEHSDPDEGSFAFRIGHQGLRHDASGLVYNRARMLHVTVGRFTSRDPLGQSQPGGGYHDGMSLYLYYAGMGSGVDPSGLKTHWRVKGVAKSFINGIPRIGRFKRDRAGRKLDPAVLKFFGLAGEVAEDIVRDTVPSSDPSDVNLRLHFLAHMVSKMSAFNENPDTDAKNGEYRLFTQSEFTFCCNGDSISNVSKIETDKEGGREGAGVYGSSRSLQIHARDSWRSLR